MRLRQQNPNNYGTSGQISQEFESIIRYLNAAEYGNLTIGELLDKIFDENGDFSGPVEFRKNTAGDIEYRIGTYSGDTGWKSLISAADLRGAPGSDVGTLGAPIFASRYDFLATNAQTEFDYAHSANDEVLVYVNGLLKRRGVGHDYTTNPTGGTNSTGNVTMLAPLATNDKVGVFRIRSTAVTGFRRQDYITTGSQSVFAFEMDEDTQIIVYKNGVLQREGGSYDYTVQRTLDTVTFNAPVAGGNLVSMITVENTTSQAITGILTEEAYCDPATGLIKLSKVGIANGAIPQSAIANLVTNMAARAVMTIAASAPVSPASGNLWLDTSTSPNQLKFYDGTAWLRTSTANSIPAFTGANATQILRVNGTGTNLEFATQDLSSVLPVTSRGAANGVASLDASGRMPKAQLPEDILNSVFYNTVSTPSNTTYAIIRIFKMKISINAIAARLASGTCTLQIAVGGVGQGGTYAVSSTPNEVSISSPIEVDATTTSKLIGFIITGASSPSALEVTLSYTNLTT